MKLHNINSKDGWLGDAGRMKREGIDSRVLPFHFTWQSSFAKSWDGEPLEHADADSGSGKDTLNSQRVLSGVLTASATLTRKKRDSNGIQTQGISLSLIDLTHTHCLPLISKTLSLEFP